jgi:hypothetical protein
MLLLFSEAGATATVRGALLSPNDLIIASAAFFRLLFVTWSMTKMTAPPPPYGGVPSLLTCAVCPDDVFGGRVSRYYLACSTK